jgi:hypothetical protein
MNDKKTTFKMGKGVTGVVNVKKAELVKNGYKDFNDWKSRKGNVYIGRDMSLYVDGAIGSIWGNPYRVAKPKVKNNESNKSNKSKITSYTLEESLKKYREHIESRADLIEKLPELKGKTLGCWCKPNKCHGDVLVELVEKYC